MKIITKYLTGVLAMAPVILAQQAQHAAAKKPVQGQSTSSVSFTVKNGEQAIEITNVSFEVTGTGVPGRPQDERLLLRMTTRSKQVIDEIGMEASTTVEAWPLGVDLKQKPLYAVTAKGMDAKTMDSAVMTIARGLEEVEWWSVYKLGSGERLFDTYTPLTRFSIARDIQTLRYVGYEAPPDDTMDAQLKAPNVVGVVTYASADKVIREALITCDSVNRAKLLRSYADSSRSVSEVERETPAAPGKKPGEPMRSIRIEIRQSFPSPPSPVTLMVPIVKDDLDLAHATLPAGMHIAAWKR